MTKHTPGPWVVQTLGFEIYSMPSGYSGIWVAAVHGRRPKPQKLADARLIASAPELLEALRSLLVFSEQHVDHDSIREAGGDDYQGHNEGEYWWADAVLSARKAIAKAEGLDDG
jgi:hypothetical protein